MKRFLILFMLILALLISNPVEAKIIHVPADSSTIQAGINAAVDGDTVLVVRGHYYERINFLGKGILVASNFIFDNDTTTIDSTVIDADTSILGISDTGSVLVFVSQEDSNSLIIGFSIQNGTGTVGQNGQRNGGGIYCVFSRPYISNNIIRCNSVSGCGGGIYCEITSRPTLHNNIIRGNSAVSGGGIFCWFFSSPRLCGNFIINNSAISCGGGICCTKLSSPIIDRNCIIGNSSSSGGGICCMYYSSPTITNNVMVKNSVDFYGGAICCAGESSPAIRNNTITGNSANCGGGIYCDNSSPAVINNIISNSLNGEGIACEYSSYPNIYHNDVWNNTDGNFHNTPAGVGDTSWGANFAGIPCDSFFNLIRNPLFADTVEFELLCNSPCIDAGDPSFYVPCDSGGCRIDMGAREYLYILGDATGDSTIDIGDVLFVINYLYKNGAPPCPYHAGDTNCDGEIDLLDILCLINYLFRGADLPC